MPASAITLRHIRAFLAVTETGSFTLAAERIGLGQSTLSQTIRDLEAEVGAKLFDRTTRLVELSEAGQAFLPGARRSIAELEAAVGQVREISELRRGWLRVAGPPFMAGSLLPRAVAAFNRDNPNVRVILSDVTVEEMVARLKDGRVDLCIGTFHATDADVRATKLLKEDLMIFCHGDHPLARMAAPGWPEVACFPSVTLVRNSGLRELIDAGFKSAGVTYQPQWEVEQISTILGMVAQRLSVAILPRSATLGSDLRDLVALPLTGPTVSREISCLQMANRTLSPAGQAFVAEVRRVFRDAAGRPGAAVAPE